MLFQPVVFPDLLICFRGRFIALELKSETGKPSKLQLYHKKLVEKAGGISIILQPHQFSKFKEFMEKLPEAGQRTIYVTLEGVNVEWLK